MRQELGSLDKVVRVGRVFGMVNAAPDFTDHPKVIERFRAAIARVNLPVQDAAWMYACCFLLVKLRQLDRHEARIPFSSYLDLCERLLTRLSTVHSP